MNESKTGGIRLGLVVAVVLLVAVVAAAILTANRPPTEYAADTPEGVVQTFFHSLQDKDYATAVALLSTSLQKDCQASELANYRDDTSRIVLEDVSTVGTETIVEVRATFVSVSDPLNPYTYQSTMGFTLIDEGGLPKISRLPYEFYCEV